MGTITDKLNWLWARKGNIAWLIANKISRKNQSYSVNQSSNFQDLINYFSQQNFTRMRLVPVMTQYVEYCYGSGDSGNAYYNQYWYSTTNYPWTGQVLDTSHCELGYNAPKVLSRSDTGVINGSVYSGVTGAKFNCPFVMGCGTTADQNNQNTWQTRRCAYTGISYYYGTSNMKILLADDASRNDGQFILGNIALVDPLEYGASIGNIALIVLSARMLFTQYSYSGSNKSNYVGLSPSTQRFEEGRYRITWSVGYNHYTYLWPMFTGVPSTDAAPRYVTVKKFVVNSTSCYVDVLTSDDASMNDAAFWAILYGRR